MTDIDMVIRATERVVDQIVLKAQMQPQGDHSANYAVMNAMIAFSASLRQLREENYP